PPTGTDTRGQAVTAIDSPTRAAHDGEVATPGGRGPKQGNYRLRFGRWWWALPAVVLMLALIYATTASGAFYAFTDWTGIGDYNFVGLDNFRRIFSTGELTGSLVNTLILAFGFLVLTNILGLLFAL